MFRLSYYSSYFAGEIDEFLCDTQVKLSVIVETRTVGVHLAGIKFGKLELHWQHTHSTALILI